MAFRSLVDRLAHLESQNTHITEQLENLETNHTSLMEKLKADLSSLRASVPRRFVCESKGNWFERFDYGMRYYLFSAQDCGGVPRGTCDGFLSKAIAAGADHDWAVVVPGETFATITQRQVHGPAIVVNCDGCSLRMEDWVRVYYYCYS